MVQSSDLADAELLIEAAKGNTGVTNSSKKYVRVLVILGNPKSASATYETKNSSGETVYSGYPYTLWSKVKESMSDQYEFKEYFTKVKSYDNVINAVANDKFDILVGFFYRTPKRLDKVNFTSPIVLSQNSILTYDKISYTQRLLITVKDLLLGPMIILFTLSLISGYILYKAEPGRSNYIDQVSNTKFKVSKKNLSLRRSIMTAVAAFFGEMGFLAENTTLSYKGLIVVIVIMILAFNYVLVLQAQATTFDAELQERGVMDRSNIKGKNFLCPEGSAAGERFERMGAKVTYLEDKNFSETIDYYTENKDQFNGVTIDSMTAARYKTRDLNLETSGFGLNMSAFAVNKNQLELLKNIDKEILKLQSSLEQERICKGYFEDESARVLCAV